MANKKGFSMNSISDVFNSASMKEVEDRKTEFRNIDINDIIVNPDNEYDISNLESLIMSISAFGIKQPLEVEKSTDGKFMIIAGERRYTATKRLVEEYGREDLRKLPCLIDIDKTVYLKDKDGNDIELDTKMRNQWLLRTTNEEQRERTNGDLIRELKQRTELLEYLLSVGYEFEGKARDIIAKDMKISSSQVQRLEFTDKNLKSTKLKEEFEKNNLPLTVAVEIAKQPEETQKAITEHFEKQGKVTAKDVQDIIEKAPTQKEQPQKADDKKEAKTELDFTVNLKTIEQTINNINRIQKVLEDDKTLDKSDYTLFDICIDTINKQLDRLIIMLEKKGK